MAYEPTPEQRLILEHQPDRHGRVLAGPGTGKSATVVDLIHRLLSRDGEQPRIRLLTFTRAATAELAGKVAAHEAEVERPSTVHSFAISALLSNPARRRSRSRCGSPTTGSSPRSFSRSSRP
jgi:superfamily I DNA/RNA helicase